MFVNALQSTFLSQGVDIPPLEDHNPAGQPIECEGLNICYVTSADVIMDMLGDHKMRKIVSNYYEESGEHELVYKAVKTAWSKENLYHDEVDGSSSKSSLAQIR